MHLIHNNLAQKNLTLHTEAVLAFLSLYIFIKKKKTNKKKGLRQTPICFKT